MPAGVHLAVVDPEVGAERRAIAVRCAQEDRVLVGPDNGLLSLAWERFGGASEAVDVARSPHRLQPVSATFHGRRHLRPWKVADTGCSRCGERATSTASDAPPKRSQARLRQPLF